MGLASIRLSKRNQVREQHFREADGASPIPTVGREALHTGGFFIMVTAMVLVNVQRGQINETAQRLLEVDGIAEVYSVTGDYDLVAVLRFQNYEELADVVTRHMQQLPTITKTHTLMAFQCYSRADLQQAWDIGVE
jgi:DNA-binding Lrp family transcriptional regulator